MEAGRRTGRASFWPLIVPSSYRSLDRFRLWKKIMSVLMWRLFRMAGNSLKCEKRSPSGASAVLLGPE